MPKRPSNRTLEHYHQPTVFSAGPFEATDAWLAAIIESSDDAIIGKTLDSVVRSWNGGAARIFGYTAAEMLGESILRLFPPELEHEENEIVGRLSRGERVDHYETVRLRKDQSIVEVSLSVSPIRDKSGLIVGAAKIARDITEAKRLQRAERLLNDQLQELAGELEQQVEEGQALAEELELTNDQLMTALHAAETAHRLAHDANAAKGAFLATMSHELRTPLNAITGYVDLLDLGLHGSLEPGQREALSRIKRSANTLLRLIDDVLNFAKLEAGHVDLRYEAVRLDDFAATLGSFIAPRVALKQLNYRLTTPGPDVVVNMDRAKTEQIMLNLLSNAVKFTDKGGIELVCTVDDHFIQLKVQDTGQGIRTELLSAIFEPFTQGDASLSRAVEGTGLGLSISRQLARAMGGEIHVESCIGEGSTFTVLLPRLGPLDA
jgi:PAS domain S-box-containing protein